MLFFKNVHLKKESEKKKSIVAMCIIVSLTLKIIRNGTNFAVISLSLNLKTFFFFKNVHHKKESEKKKYCSNVHNCVADIEDNPEWNKFCCHIVVSQFEKLTVGP